MIWVSSAGFTLFRAEEESLKVTVMVLRLGWKGFGLPLASLASSESGAAS